MTPRERFEEAEKRWQESLAETWELGNLYASTLEAYLKSCGWKLNWDNSALLDEPTPLFRRPHGTKLYTGQQALEYQRALEKDKLIREQAG